MRGRDGTETSRAPPGCPFSLVAQPCHRQRCGLGGKITSGDAGSRFPAPSGRDLLAGSTRWHCGSAFCSFLAALALRPGAAGRSALLGAGLGPRVG